MTFTTIISGWGNYPKKEAQLFAPYSCASLQTFIKGEKDLLAQGMGCRVYLKKDAVVQEVTFKSTYQKCEVIDFVQEKYELLLSLAPHNRNGWD